MDESDRVLVEASRAGDVSAFAELVRRHQGAVAACAFAVTRRPDLSEDVTQEALLLAWQKLDELRAPGQFRSWVTGIARNVAKRALSKRAFEAELATEAVATDAAGPDGAALGAEQLAILSEALKQLSASDLEILASFYGEAGSIKAVAGELGLSPQAAQKRISRARQGLTSEVGNLLSGATRGRRSAAAVAAAVIASLSLSTAAQAGPDSSIAPASPTQGALSMTALKFILPTIVVSSAVVYAVAAREQTETMSAPSLEAASASPATVSSDSKSLATPPSLPKAKDPTHAKGRWTAPAAYQLTEIDETFVAINLRGGRSGLYRFEEPTEPPPPIVRTIRGYVRSASGMPLENAVLISDHSLRQFGDSMSGGAGATTDASGSFDLGLRHDEETQIIAFHPKGWSAPTRIAAGSDDLVVNFDVETPGRLRGRVQRAGEAVEATVRIARRGSKLRLSMTSTLDGTFDFAPLPPGDYEVTIGLAQDIAGGASRHEERVVTVESGKLFELNVELPVGTLVVAEPKARTTEDYAVSYTLIPGHHEPKAPKADSVFQLGKDYEGAKNTLYGGSDKANPMQFHDTAPGEYTLCAQVITIPPRRSHSFECRQLKVSTEPIVETFEF